MTTDALTVYRQAIILWEDTPEKAFALTARYFGYAEAAAARDLFNADCEAFLAEFLS